MSRDDTSFPKGLFKLINSKIMNNMKAAVNNDDSLKILKSMIRYSPHIALGLKTVEENGRIFQHQ